MLKGERVTLRSLERDDLKRLHELSQNVELALLADGEWQPVPLAAREKQFDKQLEDSRRADFVIEADGKVIGDIALQWAEQRSRVANFGIGIYDPDYLGRGYGREAVALFADWAFRIQNYTRLWLTVWATNERAIRAYRAVGFVEEGRQRRQVFVNGKYVDVVLMGLLRDEWRGGD